MGWLLEEVGGAGGGGKLVLMGINIRGGGVEGLHGVYEVSNTDVVHREDVGCGGFVRDSWDLEGFMSMRTWSAGFTLLLDGR